LQSFGRIHVPTCSSERIMDIHLISSLASEDEARFAPALMAALTKLLDQLPIRYIISCETAGGRTFNHTHAPVEVPLGPDGADVPADVLLSLRVPEA
jgi:hypothetical protein